MSVLGFEAQEHKVVFAARLEGNSAVFLPSGPMCCRGEGLCRHQKVGVLAALPG